MNANPTTSELCDLGQVTKPPCLRFLICKMKRGGPVHGVVLRMKWAVTWEMLSLLSISVSYYYYVNYGIRETVHAYISLIIANIFALSQGNRSTHRPWEPYGKLNHGSWGSGSRVVGLRQQSGAAFSHRHPCDSPVMVVDAGIVLVSRTEHCIPQEIPGCCL